MPANGVKAAASPAGGKREVKILMLHGYTQSGPLFRTKTRAVEKLLAKSLAPFNLVPKLSYPTGPIRLNPRDVPGYEAPEGAEEEDEIEAYAWFRRSEAHGAYVGFEAGMLRIATAIAEAGGVDGVIGFSQGGAMAALLAAVLDVSRRAPSAEGNRGKAPIEAGEKGDWGWVDKVRDANRGNPLRFAVIYSGFFGPLDSIKWMYEPKVATRTLQFIGSLDSVVSEERSRGLVERCQDPVVVVHPGGHYVPVAREWVLPLVGFVKEAMEEKKEATDKGEEDEFAMFG